MTWLVIQDLEARFGAEAISQLESGGADVSVALADAEAECESWLAKVITLPITTAGPALLRIACDIARYNLWRRQLDDTHPVYIAYRRAVSDLEDAARGMMALAGLVGTETSTSTNAGSSFVAVSTSDRAFTDARLDLMTDPYMAPGAGVQF